MSLFAAEGHLNTIIGGLLPFQLDYSIGATIDATELDV
jgi:hypothetical protein